MSSQHPARGTVESPAGEDQGAASRFSVDQIANAFGVDTQRVRRAIAGEFGESDDAQVDSHQVQHLAEVMLADQPLDRRQAALMTLGAFTPRSDADFGLGDARPGEESDLLSADATVPPTELASRRSSHDPATQPTE
jgi:hypothetical protein